MEHYLNRIISLFRLLKQRGIGPFLKELRFILKNKFGWFQVLLLSLTQADDKASFEFLYNTENSNQSAYPTINLVVSTFLDLDGNNMFFGGAERYIIELYNLLNELGYKLEVYQCANSNWVRYYRKIKVYGIKTGGINTFLLNQRFHKWVPKSLLTIYFQMNLASPLFNAPSICVSHGIDWDNPWLQEKNFAYKRFLDNVLACFQNVSRVVSVDTNTINWIRATSYRLSSKFTYIPNFVNVEQFNSGKKELKENQDKLIILYPRRMYEARGFTLLTQVIPGLIQKYPNIEFHFCGKADPINEIEINSLVAKYPQNIKWFYLSPEEMHNAYITADISIIPTMYSEGTSLSCLEALASGNAVIATNVGGLPNIILPNYNGLLINPDVDEIRNALELLISNETLRNEISRNGIKTAEVFSLENWKKSWEKILLEYLPLNKSSMVEELPKTALFIGHEWFFEIEKQSDFQRLALELAVSGIDCFWVNQNGNIPNKNIWPHMFFINQNDDLYLEKPLVFLDHPANLEKYYLFQPMFIIYFGEKAVQEENALLQLLSNLTEKNKIILVHSKELSKKVNKIFPAVQSVENISELIHLINKTPDLSDKLA